MPEQTGILCVDDDNVIQILLEEVVRRAGASYCAARSVREAEELIEARTFQLVLLDRRLPDTDGPLLIEPIRARNDCPVIVLSEMTGMRDRLLGIGLGATEYVTKPFNPAELSNKIRSILKRDARRRGSGRTKAIHLGRLSFVPGPRRLVIDGHMSYLPSAEARMLQALLERHGEVLNRDELTAAACGRDWSPGDRTVDVLIARLRKRLPSGVAEIVTVHGLGYYVALS